MANVGSNVVIKMEADASQVDLGMQRATKATKKFKDETDKTNRSMRLMRGGLGQMGHQVQDIAVQLQSGQNAMLVFGQQGSQIASLFGQNGAIIGAFLAVGAALATYLMPKFFAASDAMKELDDSVKDSADNFDTLGEAMREVARLKNAEAIEAQEAALVKLQEELDAGRKFVLAGNDATVTYTETLDEFKDRMIIVRGKIEDGNKKLLELGKKTDDTTTAFERMNEKLQDQVASFGLSGAALLKYRIQVMLAKGEIKELEAAELTRLANTLQAKQDAADADAQRLLDEREARRQQERDEARAAREQERQRRARQREARNQQLAEEREIAAARANAERERRDEFLRQQREVGKLLEEQEAKAQRFADTLGDGFVDAITGAMSFKDAMRNVAKSVINDLTRMIVKKYITDQIFSVITSFTGDFNKKVPDAGMTDFDPGFDPQFVAEGGGFTGSGPRQGGVDGKGGFPAILHPNETVIDHTRGQSIGGTVVNQTINVTTGIQQTVRAEIQNLMPQIQEAAKAAVADSRMRGGSFSKAVRGA